MQCIHVHNPVFQRILYHRESILDIFVFPSQKNNSRYFDPVKHPSSSSKSMNIIQQTARSLCRSEWPIIIIDISRRDIWNQYSPTGLAEGETDTKTTMNLIPVIGQLRNKGFMQQTLIGLVPVQHTGCNWASTSPGHQV
jgi:hypothetical protein